MCTYNVPVLFRMYVNNISTLHKSVHCINDVMLTSWSGATLPRNALGQGKDDSFWNIGSSTYSPMNSTAFSIGTISFGEAPRIFARDRGKSGPSTFCCIWNPVLRWIFSRGFVYHWTASVIGFRKEKVTCRRKWVFFWKVFLFQISIFFKNSKFSQLFKLLHNYSPNYLF